jgi:hypothetical protein
MSQATIELLADSSQIKTATKDLNSLNAAGVSAEKAQKGIQASSAKASSALGNLSRNAGMAGIQVQQFVGQIQGGQSALLALSQQGADLGFVLGRAGLGAAIGITATAISFLLPVLMNASADVEELRDRIKELGDTSEATVGQIRFLAQENEKEIEKLSKSNEGLGESLVKAREELELMQKAGTGLDKGQFAVPRSAEENQLRYADAIAETKEEIVSLAAEIDTNNQEIINLSKDTATLGDESDKTAKKTASLTQSMQAQIIALESGAQAAEVYAVTQRAIADGTQEQLPSLIALINRKYELKGAQEAAAQAAKDEAASMTQLESDYQSFLTTYERYEASRLNQLQGAASGTSGLTNLQSLEQQYEAEKALLQAAQDEGIASKISYEERLTELQRQYAEKRNQIIKGEVNSQSFLTQATQDSLGVLSESFGNMASIAQSGGEDSFETYKAFASAQAVVSGILAAQNTLATAAQFYPSPIPEGMALAVAGLAAVNVAQIQSQTYSPRAVGGSVYGDNSYLVGERGPELFTPNSSGGGRITPFNQLMNQAGQQNNTTNETTNLNLNISGLYETPADMIIANRDLIIGLVADYKRRRGEAF